MTRAGSTLLAAGVAGVLIWIVAQVDGGSTGSYWARVGLYAAAGLVFGLSQMRGRRGHPRGMFLIAFLPVLVVGGWIILWGQPSNDVRDSIADWTADVSLGGLVGDLWSSYGVIAFVIGLVLGLTLEPRARLVRARDEEVAYAGPAGAAAAEERTVVDRRTADEPLSAERREAETTDAELEADRAERRAGRLRRRERATRD